MTALFISQANHTLYQDERKSKQQYLQTVAENVTEKALVIEECSSYLENFQPLIYYLHSEFTMTAENVLNFRDTVYPQVQMLQTIHPDIIYSILIYADSTHPESGYIFQNFASITDPNILSFIQSGNEAGWVSGVTDPGERYAFGTPPGLKITVYLRKIFSSSGQVVGLIGVSTTDSLLFSSLSSAAGGESVGVFLKPSTSGSTDMIYQEIPSLGIYLGIGMNASQLRGQAITNIVAIIGVMLAGLTVMAAVARLTMARLLQRLKRTVDTMSKVAAGQYNVRIQDSGSDEIGFLIGQFNFLLGTLESTVSENLDRERKQRDAQLEALQYQLNPHFIYNSMYFLQLSMEKAGQWELADAISWLAQILHYNVNGSMFATFEGEINHIQTYMKFVNTFRENPIALTVDCPEELAKKTFLRFVLQPVVENAIKYGGKDISLIEIRIYTVEGKCLLEIFNDGDLLTDETMDEVNAQFATEKEKIKSGRVGLYNIASRFRLFYQDGAGICLLNEGRTCVKIYFPLDENERAR